MCIICRNEYTSTTKEIDCNGCASLTSIPVIDGLEGLCCDRCTLLTSIPVIKGLKRLNCSGCTSLTSIPVIEGLTTLYCNGCTSLTSIPVIEGLELLSCCNCTSLTLSVPELDFSGQSVHDAFRAYLTLVGMPRDAKRGREVVQHFARCYHACNPSIFASDDTVYVLAYSIVMLDLDIHNPLIKKKMTQEEYRKSVRGINGGKDIDQCIIDAVYTSVVAMCIPMPMHNPAVLAFHIPEGPDLELHYEAKRYGREWCTIL